MPHRERVDPSPPEGIDERRRRRLGKETNFAGSGSIENGTVLGDHLIEHRNVGKDVLQVLDLPTGDQDQLAPRGGEPLQGVDRF